MKTASISTSEPSKAPFRRDIQGLRAIAVLLVLLYHAGIPVLSGGFIGVDVFFVLSGYLITGLLLRELDQTGTIRLLDFYAKRARRLLPASFTVLAFVGSVLFIAPRWLPQLVLPQLYGRSISWEIQRSGLYIVNWLYAERSVDYHNAAVPSPLQHFWSLAVEEQFYAVWPVLILGVAFVAGSLGAKRSRPALAVVLTILTLASFVYSYRYSLAEPSKAYFVTTTRAWELSIGGLLALGLPKFARGLSRRSSVNQQTFATACSVGGLAAVLGASVVISAETAFPGVAAALPVAGTLAIITGGHLGRTVGFSTLLETRFMQWTGERSYSLYLWHWPLLWLARTLFGTPTVVQALVIVAVSAFPAMVSYRWIEQPFRHHQAIATPLRGIALGGLATVVAYSIGLFLLHTTTETESTFRTAESVTQVVEVLGVQLTADEITPSFADARDDRPAGYETGCFEQFTCELGDATAETTVVLVGNSHAAHWVPALEALAEQRDWRLIVMVASGCRTAITTPADEREFERCETWPEQVRDDLPTIVRDSDADLVLVSESRFRDPLTDESEMKLRSLTSSYTESWEYLERIPTPVAVIRPVPGGHVIGVDCPSLLAGSLRDCAMPLELASSGDRAILDAAYSRGLPILDMNDYICVDDVCPAVINDLLVRRDNHHLTNTFALALTDVFGARLDELIHRRGWDEGLTAR